MSIRSAPLRVDKAPNQEIIEIETCEKLNIGENSHTERKVRRVNEKRSPRLRPILWAILILISVIMISCGQGGITEQQIKEEDGESIIPIAGAERLTPTLVPQVSIEKATPLPISTATSVPQPVPMPSLLWEVPTSANLEGTTWFSPAGVFFTMTLTDVKLSVEDNYSIAAFDSRTGEQKWIKEGTYVPKHIVGSKLPALHVIGSELVLIGSQIFDAVSGILKCEIPDSIPQEDGWTGFPGERIVLVQAAQDYVYLLDNPNGSLLAVDCKIGEMKWSKSIREDGVKYVNLVLVEGTLYGAQTYGIKSINALDRFTGEVRWSYTPDIMYPWSPRFGFLPFTANQKGAFGLRGLSPLIVFYVDPLSKLQWESEVETNLSITADTSAYLRSVEGVLIVTVVENFLYGPVHIYGVDETTGELLFQSTIEDPSTQSPLLYSKVGNSSIVYYVLSRNWEQEPEEINVVDLESNEILGSYQLPGKAASTMFSEGVLYVLIKTDETSSILALELPE